MGRRNLKPYGIRERVEKWRHVGGAVGANGREVVKPFWLSRAEMIDSLCQRYGCLPSQLLEEDAELLVIAGLVNEERERANGDQ